MNYFHHYDNLNPYRSENFLTPFQRSVYNQHRQMFPRQLSAEDAIEIAISQVPGTVVDVDLDTENGILVWEIEIVTPQGMKYEVDVDANTGNILKAELD
ncbi:PepSY domain-containing protein [Alteribacter salitolerans]|uniref:PepSY domain-containing protein n=1 Tax=Alteribacter salitolerans TaxID=2912333 RepID=UPI001F32F9D2|nr:PepSY domain-containing protein [Alteribacter salitolerans]